jgi:hypothetical protein
MNRSGERANSKQQTAKEIAKPQKQRLHQVESQKIGAVFWLFAVNCLLFAYQSYGQFSP